MNIEKKKKKLKQEQWNKEIHCEQTHNLTV